MARKTKFMFLLGLVLAPRLIYAQELKVLRHIPAEEIESSLYDATFAGTVVWYPVLAGYNLTISPDGRLISFWSAKNLSVKVMDLETKKIIAELDDPDIKDKKNWSITPIDYLTFTPDSRFLAILLAKASLLKIWDFSGAPPLILKQTDVEKKETEQKEETKVITLSLPPLDKEDYGARYEPSHIAFSPDGKYLATSIGTRIYLWGTANWEIIKTLKSPIPYGGRELINQLAFSPDTKYLVSRCGSQISVWELFESRETEEWKKWDEQARECEMKLIMEKANVPQLTPEQQKVWEERLKKCREHEPPRYVTIFTPHLFLPDIRSPHEVGKVSRVSPLVFSPDGRYLITDVYRFDFTPDEWKSQLEKSIKAEEFNANFQAFSGPRAPFAIAVYGDLVALGAWGDKEATASIFNLSELKELASFSTVKDRKKWPEDITHLIFFFPDGKRLFTYNNREGIYIFDISTLKK